MSKNFVIQLGTHYRAELTYMTKRNWFQEMLVQKYERHKVPVQFCHLQEPWNYIGVDINHDRIKSLRKYHRDNLNVKFLEICVCDKNNAQIPHNNDSIYSKNSADYEQLKFKSQGIMLSDLFSKVGADEADNLLLYMNVEASEAKIFKGFNWQVPISFASICCHSIEIVKYLCQLFLKNDYYLYNTLPNMNEVKDLTVQFIHESRWDPDFDRYSFQLRHFSLSKLLK